MGVWVFMFLAWRLIHPSQKIATIGLALTLLGLMIIGVQFYIPEELIERRVVNQNTIMWRFERWIVAFQAGVQNPIFGVGLNNLRDILASKLGNYYSVHNFFLTLFAELGMVGLIAYLTIMLSIVRRGLTLCTKGKYPRDQWRGVALVSLVVAQLTTAFFADTIQNTGLWLVYPYVFLGAIAGLYTVRTRITERGRPPILEDFGAGQMHVQPK